MSTPNEVEAQKKEFRGAITVERISRLAQPTTGIRTVEAVRSFLLEWLNLEHGTLTFRLTQVLSGYGCFGRYLWRIARRESTLVCHGDGCAEDTAQHTLEECPSRTRKRAILVAKIGDDLSLPTVVKSMVDSSRS
nr:uncharacterized protein LOC116776072 [Danaus plexippus plexippus]